MPVWKPVFIGLFFLFFFFFCLFWKGESTAELAWVLKAADRGRVIKEAKEAEEAKKEKAKRAARKQERATEEAQKRARKKAGKPWSNKMTPVSPV